MKNIYRQNLIGRHLNPRNIKITGTMHTFVSFQFCLFSIIDHTIQSLLKGEQNGLNQIADLSTHCVLVKVDCCLMITIDITHFNINIFILTLNVSNPLIWPNQGEVLLSVVFLWITWCQQVKNWTCSIYDFLILFCNRFETWTCQL